MFGFAVREFELETITNSRLYVVVDHAKPNSPIPSQPTLSPAYAETGAGEGWQSLPFEPHPITVTGA